jgi:hypothetical protein
MLKKIVLIALFVASAAVGATATVSAHSATKAPVPTAPQALCPTGMC